MSLNLSENIFNLPLSYYIPLDNKLSETVYAFVFQSDGTLVSRNSLSSGKNEVSVPHKIPYMVVVARNNGQVVSSLCKVMPSSR